MNLISLDYRESESRQIEAVQAINVNIIHKIFDLLDLADCQSIVNLSSVQVYGHFRGETFSEDTHPSPSNLYGLTHLQKEEMLNYYSARTGVKAVNLRLSNVYGPSMDINEAFLKLVCNDFCFNALKNKEIRILSDGTPMKDFVYIEDVLSAILFTLKEPLEAKVYNLASGKAKTLLFLAQMVQHQAQEIIGEHVSIQIADKIESFDYDQELIQYSNELFISTGFQLQYSLETGLEDFLIKLYNQIESAVRKSGS